MTRDYSKVHARRRAAMLAARVTMGSKCVRCEITDPLVWDHINDDGYATKTASGRRRKPGLSGSYGEFLAIVRTGTSTILQLLCPNCNHLKQFDRAAFDRPPTYGMISNG